MDTLSTPFESFYHSGKKRLKLFDELKIKKYKSNNFSQK